MAVWTIEMLKLGRKTRQAKMRPHRNRRINRPPVRARPKRQMAGHQPRKKIFTITIDGRKGRRHRYSMSHIENRWPAYFLHPALETKNTTTIINMQPHCLPSSPFCLSLENLQPTNHRLTKAHGQPIRASVITTKGWQPNRARLLLQYHPM